MTTSTKRARTLREKRAREGLAEVRGIWWDAKDHAQYKALVKAAPEMRETLEWITSLKTGGMIEARARAAIKATEPAQRMR